MNSNSLLSALLLPITPLWWLVDRLRFVYWTLRGRYESRVPVIVVGNCAVGGTGKTPVVQKLISLAQAQGLRVGVVARGYKGSLSTRGAVVNSNHTAMEVGDEPLMHYKSGALVSICANRRWAIRQIESEVDIIISDDGAQHYAIKPMRLIELESSVKPRWLLPAGRYRTLSLPSDLKLLKGSDFYYEFKGFTNIYSGNKGNLQKVVVATGIANPDDFLCLVARHVDVVGIHRFSDHTFDKSVLSGEIPVVVTAKDAVKLNGCNAWLCEVDCVFTPEAESSLAQLLYEVMHG